GHRLACQHGVLSRRSGGGHAPDLDPAVRDVDGSGADGAFGHARPMAGTGYMAGPGSVYRVHTGVAGGFGAHSGGVAAGSEILRVPDAVPGDHGGSDIRADALDRTG